MDNNKHKFEETLDRHLSLRWFAGIKKGTLRMSQISNKAFFTQMLQISNDLEEYEVSGRIQNRIDELNCTHPDEFVICTNGYRTLCLNCGKNVN